MTSAWSITQSVGAPRGAFVDFPLGHTSGRPDRPDEQAALVGQALALFESLERPGEIVPLPFAWAGDDEWKDDVMRPKREAERGAEATGAPADDRTQRHDGPQYQDERDRRLAEEAIASGGCATCVFPG